MRWRGFRQLPVPGCNRKLERLERLERPEPENQKHSDDDDQQNDDIVERMEFFPEHGSERMGEVRHAGLSAGNLEHDGEPDGDCEPNDEPQVAEAERFLGHDSAEPVEHGHHRSADEQEHGDEDELPDHEAEPPARRDAIRVQQDILPVFPRLYTRLLAS